MRHRDDTPKIGIALIAATLLIAAPARPGRADVTVEIFKTHTVDTGGGAPYADPVGSFSAPKVAFATDTGFNWHPFDLGVFGAQISGCLELPETTTVTFGLTPTTAASSSSITFST